MNGKARNIPVKERDNTSKQSSMNPIILASRMINGAKNAKNSLLHTITPKRGFPIKEKIKGEIKGRNPLDSFLQCGSGAGGQAGVVEHQLDVAEQAVAIGEFLNLVQ